VASSLFYAVIIVFPPAFVPLLVLKTGIRGLDYLNLPTSVDKNLFRFGGSPIQKIIIFIFTVILFVHIGGCVWAEFIGYGYCYRNFAAVHRLYYQPSTGVKFVDAWNYAHPERGFTSVMGDEYLAVSGSFGLFKHQASDGVVRDTKIQPALNVGESDAFKNLVEFTPSVGYSANYNVGTNVDLTAVSGTKIGDILDDSRPYRFKQSYVWNQLALFYSYSVVESAQMCLGLGISIWEPKAVPAYKTQSLYTQVDHNPLALCFLIIFTVIGFIFSSLLISILVLSVQQLNVLSSRHQETLAFMESALEKLGIGENIKEKVRALKTYEILHYDTLAMSVLFGSKGGGGGGGGEQQGNSSAGGSSNPCVNSTLLLELKTFLYYDMISKSSLFSNTDNFDFLSSLVHYLTDEIVLPGDYICRKGETGREMFFILKGEASVLIRNERRSPYLCNIEFGNSGPPSARGGIRQTGANEQGAGPQSITSKSSKESSRSRSSRESKERTESGLKDKSGKKRERSADSSSRKEKKDKKDSSGSSSSKKSKNTDKNKSVAFVLEGSDATVGGKGSSNNDKDTRKSNRRSQPNNNNSDNSNQKKSQPDNFAQPQLTPAQAQREGVHLASPKSPNKSANFNQSSESERNMALGNFRNSTNNNHNFTNANQAPPPPEEGLEESPIIRNSRTTAGPPGTKVNNKNGDSQNGSSSTTNNHNGNSSSDYGADSKSSSSSSSRSRTPSESSFTNNTTNDQGGTNQSYSYSHEESNYSVDPHTWADSGSTNFSNFNPGGGGAVGPGKGYGKGKYGNKGGHGGPGGYNKGHHVYGDHGYGGNPNNFVGGPGVAVTGFHSFGHNSPNNVAMTHQASHYPGVPGGYNNRGLGPGTGYGPMPSYHHVPTTYTNRVSLADFSNLEEKTMAMHKQSTSHGGKGAGGKDHEFSNNTLLTHMVSEGGPGTFGKTMTGGGPGGPNGVNSLHLKKLHSLNNAEIGITDHHFDGSYGLHPAVSDGHQDMGFDSITASPKKSQFSSADGGSASKDKAGGGLNNPQKSNNTRSNTIAVVPPNVISNVTPSSNPLVLIKILSAGDHFGEFALITKQRRAAWVRANCYSVVLKLTARAFQEVLADFPTESETIYKRVAELTGIVTTNN